MNSSLAEAIVVKVNNIKSSSLYMNLIINNEYKEQVKIGSFFLINIYDTRKIQTSFVVLESYLIVIFYVV